MVFDSAVVVGLGVGVGVTSALAAFGGLLCCCLRWRRGESPEPKTALIREGEGSDAASEASDYDGEEEGYEMGGRLGSLDSESIPSNAAMALLGIASDNTDLPKRPVYLE